MAIITKITAQKKQKERYNIFLDHGKGEEYAFSVNEAILVRYQLRKGLELTKEDIEAILSEEFIRKGYHAAINYLSYRMRSEKEVEDYLVGKEYPIETISIIIERLRNERYLDDREFAQAFVRSRMNVTTKGPLLIKRELIEKGLKEAEIIESLAQYSNEDQIEKAAMLIQKKDSSARKTSNVEHNRKLYTLLVSKGFTKEIIQAALHSIQTDENQREEWDAITYQGEKLIKKFRAFPDWERRQKVKQGLYRKGFSLDLIEKFLSNEG